MSSCRLYFLERLAGIEGSVYVVFWLGCVVFKDRVYFLITIYLVCRYLFWVGSYVLCVFYLFFYFIS